MFMNLFLYADSAFGPVWPALADCQLNKNKFIQ